VNVLTLNKGKQKGERHTTEQNKICAVDWKTKA